MRHLIVKIFFLLRWEKKIFFGVAKPENDLLTLVYNKKQVSQKVSGWCRKGVGMVSQFGVFRDFFVN